MEMKLSQSQKESLVAEVQAKMVTMKQLAGRYGVSQPLVSRVFKKMTGSALRPRRAKVTQKAQTIPLMEVLETIAELRKEHPSYPFIIKINLKDQIVSIR